MSNVVPGLTGAALLGAVLGLFVLVALGVAPRSKRPTAALAWILVITFLPILGLMLFLVFGSSKLPRSRRDKQRGVNDQFIQRSRQVKDLSHRAGTPQWFPALARLNRNLGAMPLLEGNSARLLSGFDDQLAALVQTVEDARRYVHVEFYILSYDSTTAPFFAALKDAVQRGVTVRVLLDH